MGMICTMKCAVTLLTTTLLQIAPLATVFAQDDESEQLTEITVTGKRIANTRPAGSYASIATALRFDPGTELQSRGLPEGQADVTVRGGLFENTGFRAGAITIMDPQTGHYAADLPIDPELLTGPELLIGIENAVAGFNSSIATVDYAFRKLEQGGSVSLGAGSDNLRFGSLRMADATTSDSGAHVGYAMAIARSQGDGTVPDGDHDFTRYNVQLQFAGDSRQTDLLLSHQDKFYGWPGAYTGFASLPETDHTRATLLLGNHRFETERGHAEVGAFYRRLEDDYDFDRRTTESGGPGAFDHETRVYGVGFDGVTRGGRLDWHYAGQLAADELLFSTDLTEGNFDSRDYASISLVPELRLEHAEGREVTLQFGATVDWSSRDGSDVSPLLAATLRSATASGVRLLSLEYAVTTQLPGYTVLNSRPAGLFGGNPDLGRETARQLSLSGGYESDRWDGTVTVFYRKDDDLVDWTFASGAPFARQANAVDIDVAGVELFARGRWTGLDVVASYTYLDKDADYGSATVDASFYALNFATHRATLAAHYRFGRNVELRFDSEYRRQRGNPLRAGSDEAVLTSLALAWEPQSGIGLALTADNLTDDDYQQFPGTPAVGRQVSLSARYRW
jgi:hypothetical protein